MFDVLKNCEKKIFVIGFGYVGLLFVLEFVCDFEVIGFDINEDCI